LDGVLDRGMTSGLFRDMNVQEAADVFANLLYGMVVCGCLGGVSDNLKPMAEQAVDVFLHGILQQPTSSTSGS
jgi:hypothetical protein